MLDPLDVVLVLIAVLQLATLRVTLRFFLALNAQPQLQLQEEGDTLASGLAPDPTPVRSGPAGLTVLSDEAELALEQQTRVTRGATASRVCAYWDEQDELEAEMEDEQQARERQVFSRFPRFSLNDTID